MRIFHKAGSQPEVMPTLSSWKWRLTVATEALLWQGVAWLRCKLEAGSNAAQISPMAGLILPEVDVVTGSGGMVKEEECLPTGWKQCSSVCEPVPALDGADSLSQQLFENMPILTPREEQLEDAPVVETVTDEIEEEIAIPEAAWTMEPDACSPMQEKKTFSELRSRIGLDMLQQAEVEEMSPDSQESTPTCDNEGDEEHPAMKQSMVMIKLQQKPAMMSLGEDLRERQSIVVKDNNDFPDSEVVKNSKLEEFAKDSGVWHLLDVGRDSKLLMPQEVDPTLDSSPEKVMKSEHDLRDTASALPSSISLGDSSRGTLGRIFTEMMREMLRPENMEVTLDNLDPEKVMKVESKVKDTASALPSSSGLGVSTKRTQGTSLVEISTVTREERTVSSGPSTSAKSRDKFQVTSWFGREHFGSESPSSRRSQHNVEGPNINLFEAELHGQGVRERLVCEPGGGRCQVCGEGHGADQPCGESRLYTSGRTGSGLNQLLFTSHSSVTTNITGQVSKFSTQRLKHSPFSMLDLMKFINGVARRVSYGGSHMMALAETNGPQVLRLPSTWLSISPRWQRLLYLGRSNVEDSWPFMETGLGTMASVAPFEVTDNDNMQPIVMIIPVEFVTPLPYSQLNITF